MIKETYLAVLSKMKRRNPDAEFIVITRREGHVLSPSWDVLNAYKVDHDWDKYTERFLKEMESPACQDEIERIAKLAKTKDVFLVCFEAPGKNCHRYIVRDLVEQRMNEL